MRKVLQGIVGSGVGDPSRRNFLKGAAALGASALLPSSELPAQAAQAAQAPAGSQTEQGLLKPLGDGPLGDDATVDKDVMVRMGDGVRIACDVYRPKAPGRYPVLYASSCYIKDAVWVPTGSMYNYRETGNIARWVKRGYVYLHVDIRGSGKSEGHYDFFGPREQRDHYEIIEWAGVQPWSNGKVGMFGESYYGMSQWAAAWQNPPHLACIAPYEGHSADIYREFSYIGGILQCDFMNHWWNNSVRDRHFLDYPEHPKRADYMDTDLNRDLVLHPTYDEYWKSRTFDVKAVKVPVFSIGAWGSMGLHLYGDLQKTSGPMKMLVTSGNSQKLFQEPVVEEPLNRWYDYWLKGIDNGIMKEPPVRIFVCGGQGYRDEQEWPLKRAQARKLYLRPGPSGAVESLNDGALSWEPAVGSAPPTSYDSPDVEWHLWGGIVGSTVLGAHGLPNTTRRIITFTSAPLEQDLEVSGPVALHLWASTTGTDDYKFTKACDAHFIANLMDMPPVSGELAAAIKTLDVSLPASEVTKGALKASHRALDRERSTPLFPYHTHTNPQPLEPGKVYEFAIQLMPTCWVFKAGHRIRLDLQSFDNATHLGNLRGTDSFYHDAERPSHLLLSVV